MGKITYAHAFAVLPKVSGCLSMIGSTYIIQDVLRDPAKQRRTYCRLLFGASVFDVITSFMYFLSTWPIPAEEPPLYAAGSTATCTAQGFFIQMSIAVPVYNLGLAAYYFLVLVKNWQDYKLKEFEKYVHVLALLLGVGTATAGLPLKLYNNSNLWCWISSLPMSCKGGINADGGTGACLRGQSAWVYRWAFYYAPLWAIIFTITISMAFVTRHVFKTEKKSRRWQFSKVHLQSLSSRVFWQSIHYVLAFYATWIFPTTLRLLQTFGIAVPPFVIVGMCICLPLQGFWNAVTYAKPRLHNQRGSMYGRSTILGGMSHRFSSMSRRFTSTRALGQSDPPRPAKSEEDALPPIAPVAQSKPATTKVHVAELTALEELEDIGTWDPSLAFQRMSVVLSAQDLQPFEGVSQQLTMRDLTSTEFNSGFMEMSSTTSDLEEKHSQSLRNVQQHIDGHGIEPFGDEIVRYPPSPRIQNLKESGPQDSSEPFGDDIVPHPPGSKMQSVEESSPKNSVEQFGDELLPHPPGSKIQIASSAQDSNDEHSGEAVPHPPRQIHCPVIPSEDESSVQDCMEYFGDEIAAQAESRMSQSVVGEEASAQDSVEDYGDVTVSRPSGPKIWSVEESRAQDSVEQCGDEIVPRPPASNVQSADESSAQDSSLVPDGLAAPVRIFGSGILSSLRDECYEHNHAQYR